jgi:alpha-mannosidase
MRIKKNIFVPLILIIFIFSFKSDAVPERKWEIYLIHHTHLDIGFTHPQEEVMKIQWKHLETAMDLIEKTKDYPDDAKFRWNPEVTWAIDAWFEQADEEQKKRFINHIKNNSIGIDALYGNMLTGLMRPSEFMESVSGKSVYEKLTDKWIDSIMITDVPGASWGMVTALHESGIRYVSIGPNRTHRIGYTRKVWGDRPFYWESGSGQHRVLCFVHGQGYSWFHQLNNMGMKKNLLSSAKILPYLKKLEKEGYPYDIIPIRYNIGADNGPPDLTISDQVKKWNEKHPDIRMRISTTSEAFSEFEKRYADQIPVYRGDFTPYWEDGAASSARETAITRNASEKLDQLQTVWTLIDDGDLPQDKFRDAWKEVLLFNEHTWGAHNAISQPYSEFAKTQWKWKEQRAINSLSFTNDIQSELSRKIAEDNIVDSSTYIEVINTHSWPVTGPVKTQRLENSEYNIETTDGKPVNSQILSDGALFFLAEDVPPFSSKKYILKPANKTTEGACSAKGNTISNGNFEIMLDEETGTISSLRNLEDGKEFVNNNFKDKFNEYIYIQGRSPQLGRRKGPKPETKITAKEEGPLYCSIEIEREVKNSNSLVTTITMYDGLDRVDIKNTLDRPVVKKKEGIHFAFPVNVNDPKVRYDLAWETAQVDVDQLEGACKNYYTPLRWVDVSGDNKGLSIVLVDAPLFEVGEITTDAFIYGWLKKTKQNGVIYSYVMNNYWETNYKAFQPGVTQFRYSLFPHGEYSAVTNNKDSLEVMQPMIVSNSTKTFKMPKQYVTSSNANIAVFSIKSSNKGGGLVFQLYNMADSAQDTTLKFSAQCSYPSIVTNGINDYGSPAPSEAITFGKHDVFTVRCGW